MNHIVLVTGGRDYANTKVAFATLDAIHAYQPIDLLIHGGAKGADDLADRWARANEVPCHREPARWTRYGNSAGPRRNAVIGDMLARLQATRRVLVAFPGGSGTKHMTDYIERLIAGGALIEIIRAGTAEELVK